MWIHLAYSSDKKGRKYSERGDKNLEGDWFNLHLVTSQQLECVAFSFSTLWFLLGARISEELLESEPSSCGANLMTFKPYKAKLTRSSVAFFVAFGFASSSSCLCLSSCSSPQMDQLLGSVMEMWVDRMDNITQPERRKLSSLALLSLLPSDNRCNTFSSSSRFHTLLPSASTSRKKLDNQIYECRKKQLMILCVAFTGHCFFMRRMMLWRLCFCKQLFVCSLSALKSCFHSCYFKIASTKRQRQSVIRK